MTDDSFLYPGLRYDFSNVRDFKLHATAYPDWFPREFKIRCFWCGEQFTRDRSQHSLYDTQGDSDEFKNAHFCSKSCSSKAIKEEGISGRKAYDSHRFCAYCLQKFTRVGPSKLTGTHNGKLPHSDWATCSPRCRNRIQRRLETQKEVDERIQKAQETKKENSLYERENWGTHENSLAALREHHEEAIAKSAELRKNNPELAARIHQKSLEARDDFYWSTKLAMKFRSTWELRFAEKLVDKGILFEHEPGPIKTPHGMYFPDFRILTEDPFYVEIKGIYREKQQRKISWVQDQADMDIVILTSPNEAHSKPPDYGQFFRHLREGRLNLVEGCPFWSRA